MRTFGVEEELLLVRAADLRPMSAGEIVVRRFQERSERPVDHFPSGGFPPPPAASGHLLKTELQQEQLEVVGPPLTTLEDQLSSIRSGRALADEAAQVFDGRVIAAASPIFPRLPHVVGQLRYRRMAQRFGLLTAEQLTCGYHVHVSIDSRDEGVQVLDRIRVWLPVLLALSANSPFWYGRDTGYSSYRNQAWSRWPTAGPVDQFGSVEEYDRRCEALIRSGAALDLGMMYFDARLSHRNPTVEVRIADVCLSAEHAAALAALVRALVETAARQADAGVPAPGVPAALLRAWSWHAAKCGVDDELVSPTVGEARPADVVVTELLDFVRPVLAEYGEDVYVEAVVAEMLRDGTGSRRQREAYARREDIRDVLDAALQLTHHPGRSVRPVDDVPLSEPSSP